ncbi:MAG TPA: hypothetical protein VE086_06625 [Chthoniobacterales bacterium]|nr:hypothetical protein [Chthoniobacterales bacterium]
MCSLEGEALLILIRTEIQRYGHSIVDCERLLVLISPGVSIATHYGHIFLAAESERWNFEFQTDGTVRFTALDRPPLPISATGSSPSRKAIVL